MRTRTLPILLTVLAILAALCAGFAVGVRAVIEGGKPMDDGLTLAGGRIERVIDGYVSAFVIEGVEGVVLVDSGMDPEASAIRTALARRGYGPADVRAIVLTHGHGDHIGGAAAFPDALLLALGPDVDLAEGTRVADNALSRGQEPSPTGLRVTRGLRDGDSIDIGSVHLEAFAVPGHSLGSAALLCEGVLFLGDAGATTADDRLEGPPPVFSADRQAGDASLAALARRLAPRAAEIRWICPSHQGCIEGADALLAWAER